MRITLSEDERLQLFAVLAKKGVSVEQLAEMTGVSTRTITDWRRGKYTMPDQHFKLIAQHAVQESESLHPMTIEDWWSNSSAGKKGAQVRMDKHGPIGTPEGRHLGGLNSYKARRDKPDEIFTPKTIHKPDRSELLAEFIGILIGDGGVTKYQVVVATNAVDDYEYSLFVAQLIKQLFGLNTTLTKRKTSNCLTIVASSVKLVDFLMANGIPQGNKLRQNHDIPAWVLENRAYSIACLRGIFDTDGCIFQERHTINGKLYCYPRLSFVSMSNNLRQSIHQVLADLEFSPKIRNNRSVNLESSNDIKEYFRIIGSSNSKHLDRYSRFGGVG